MHGAPSHLPRTKYLWPVCEAATHGHDPAKLSVEWISTMTRRCHHNDGQDTSHGDRLLRRQEVLTARADAKTVAESAMEVSYVMQLSQALLEAGDIIQKSTQARHRYLAVQKDHEEAKETQGESKATCYWYDARTDRSPYCTSSGCSNVS